MLSNQFLITKYEIPPAPPTGWPTVSNVVQETPGFLPFYATTLSNSLQSGPTESESRWGHCGARNAHRQARKASPKEKAYKLADGQGLHLYVTPAGFKSWRLKYRYGGKEKQLVFGP